MNPKSYFCLVIVLAPAMILALSNSGATEAPLINFAPSDTQKTHDISGAWNSSIDVIFQINQIGDRFYWQHPKSGNQASGSIHGEELSAVWIVRETSQPVTGRITEFNSSGRPIRIEWSNGVFFFRGSKPKMVSPIQGWCCKDGDVFATTITECNKLGGKFFKTQELAEEFCRDKFPEPEHGFCCLEGKIFPANMAECHEAGGRFFPNREEAEEFCRSHINLKPNEVRPFEKADFAITALTCEPVYPQPGEQSIVKVDVLSRSKKDRQNIKLAFLVDGQIKEVIPVNIQGRSSSEFLFDWRPPQAGVYVLRAVLNPDMIIDEVSIHDNSLNEEIVVSKQPAEGSDFEIIIMRWKEQEDKPPVPQATIRNNGKQRASIPLVFLDKNEELSRRLVGPIEPGGEIAVDGPAIVDKPFRQFRALVNPRFFKHESDQSDNLKSIPFQLVGDLTIEKLTFHERREGSKFSNRITVSFRIVNGGGGDIHSPFKTHINIRSNGTNDSYDLSTPGLDAGETLYVARSFKRPLGPFEVEVEADSGRSIPEHREDNNIAKWQFKGTTSDIGRWVSIGPSRIKAIGHLDAVGRLYHTAIDPKNRSTIYVGVPSPYGDKTGSGIWKTNDSGKNWYPVSDSFESCAITALAVDPANPSRVYALTPVGLYRTNDGGTSWRRIHHNTFNLGTKLIVNTKRPKRLISMSSLGIFLSTNSGENWYPVLSGGASDDIVQDPNNPDRLYAALYHKTDFKVAGIYESTDGGDNWRKITGCPGGKLPDITEDTGLSLGASPNTLYVGYKKKGKFELYRTIGPQCKVGSSNEMMWEAGWSTTNPISEIEADPNSPNFLIAYFAGELFYLSTNGGKNFSKIEGRSPHVDQHGVFYDPVDSKIVYIVNDGGIYRSDNHGKQNSWTYIGEGICNIEFFDIAIAKTDPDLIIGGTQDNGTIRYKGKNTIWQEFNGSDGAYCDIDPTNSAIQYHIEQYPTSLRYVDETGKHVIGSGLPAGSVYGNMHYQLHPGKPDVLLACAGALYRRDNARSSNASWKKIFIPSSTDGDVWRVGVDPSVDIYYAGTIWGRLYAGPDGKKWNKVFQHPSGCGILDIEIDPNSPKIVYLACGGRTGSGRIYRLTRDAIVPINTGNMPDQPIANGIPDSILVNAVAVDRLDSSTIYAGTSKGVYRGRTKDGGQSWTWEFHNTGIPAGVDIKDIEVHPTTGVIRAATMGRGAYEMQPEQQLGMKAAGLGKITSIRLHEVGTGYGSPNDKIDADVIVTVDNIPNIALGFQLRKGPKEGQQIAMLNILRDAFKTGRNVRIEYKRTGYRIGIIQRVIIIQ